MRLILNVTILRSYKRKAKTSEYDNSVSDCIDTHCYAIEQSILPGNETFQ